MFSYRISLTVTLRYETYSQLALQLTNPSILLFSYKSHSKGMHGLFGIALVLITAVSRISAKPLYSRQSVGLCNASGRCKGYESQCCSATAILFCNGVGMLQSSNCVTGGICVDLSNTLAICQSADICDSVGSKCSIETFDSRCCADGTRFVACQNNELSIYKCSGPCNDDGNFAICKDGVVSPGE